MHQRSSPGYLNTKCGMFLVLDDSTIWRLRCGPEMKEIRIVSRVSVPDPTIHHQLAVAGVGVGLHNRRYATMYKGPSGDAFARRAADLVELYAVYPSRLSSSPKVRAFVHFLRKRLATDSWHKLEDSALAPDRLTSETNLPANRKDGK